MKETTSKFDLFKDSLEKRYNDEFVVSDCCDWCDKQYIMDNYKFTDEEKEKCQELYTELYDGGTKLHFGANIVHSPF